MHRAILFLLNKKLLQKLPKISIIWTPCRQHRLNFYNGFFNRFDFFALNVLSLCHPTYKLNIR